MPAPLTLLLDNGSLAPAATLRLRELAAALAARIGEAVEPVSLLHSSAIPVAELGGVPAEIFEPAVARRATEGRRDFVVVPLFFGPSRALTDYLPDRVAALRAKWPDLRVRLAPTLFQEGDNRLASIFVDHLTADESVQRVAFVDHGSPAPQVTAVREALVAQVRAMLDSSVEIVGCCMERRPGAEFDFNGPLLADLLARGEWSRGPVTVAMQFLLPGRHAGPEGDVAQICRAARERAPQLVTRLTPLVGEHPRLLEILVERWASRQDASPF